jgi:thiol-disulfide isomerase/thioredoxin
LKIEEFQFCPKCGAALNPSAGVTPESASATTVTCGACGTTFHESDFGGRGPVQQPAAGGNRNPLALVVVAVIAAAMLYFGFHAARRSGPTPVATKSSPAPDFTLESLDGKSMRLSDLRGKAVLLNFWATWCGPCKIETPWLVELQNQYGAQGLQVLGVAMDDSGKDDIAKFAKDMGVNYPVLLGKEAVGDAYGGVPALPESFFIGRDGKIVDKIIGLKGRSEIEDSIKKALDTPAGSTQASAAPYAAVPPGK